MNSTFDNSIHYWPYDNSYTWTWTSPSPERCQYCDGLWHKDKPEMCPRVKSISYFEDGSISKITFHKTT